jgi:hypothetical protein
VSHSRNHLGQWQQGGNHVLFWNCTFANKPFYVRDDSAASNNGRYTHFSNLSIRDCSFNELIWAASTPSNLSVAAINNHFRSGVVHGQSATSGDPMYIDPANGNFMPRPGSPLLGRVSQPLVPIDALGTERVTPSTVGALTPAP